MNKKYCDICGHQVRSMSLSNESPHGVFTKVDGNKDLRIERHIFVKTTFKDDSNTDTEYLGVMCTPCYAKVKDFIKEMQDGKDS